MCVTLSTKLRESLNLPTDPTITNPLPVTESTATRYLEVVLESPQVWVDFLGYGLDIGTDQVTISTTG